MSAGIQTNHLQIICNKPPVTWLMIKVSREIPVPLDIDNEWLDILSLMNGVPSLFHVLYHRNCWLEGHTCTGSLVGLWRSKWLFSLHKKRYQFQESNPLLVNCEFRPTLYEPGYDASHPDRTCLVLVLSWQQLWLKTSKDFMTTKWNDIVSNRKRQKIYEAFKDILKRF